MDSKQEIVELIRTESERVMNYLGGLPKAALINPTPCEAWDVSQVIAHLVWFAETYGGMAERGLRGDLSAPVGLPPKPGTLSGPKVEEFYAQAAINRRRELGHNLISEFVARYDWLHELMNGIGPEDWTKPCYHTNRIQPVEWFPGVVIQELVIHEWDIRSTLESAPPLSECSLPCLMERVSTRRRPWSIPFPKPVSRRYRFDLTGPGASRLDVVVEGNTTRQETGAEGPADLYINGDTSSYVLMMFDRLTLNSAIDSGRLKAEGDESLVGDFDLWLAGH